MQKRCSTNLGEPATGTNVRSLAVPTINGRGLGMALKGSNLPIPGAGRKVWKRRKGDTPHFDPEPIADCDPSLGIETGQNPVPAEHARFAEARFAPR